MNDRSLANERTSLVLLLLAAAGCCWLTPPPPIQLRILLLRPLQLRQLVLNSRTGLRRLRQRAASLIEHAAGTGTSISARLAAELRKTTGEDIAHIAIKATVVTLRRGISTLSLLNLANRRPPRLVLWAGSLLLRRHRPPLALNIRAI